MNTINKIRSRKPIISAIHVDAAIEPLTFVGCAGVGSTEVGCTGAVSSVAGSISVYSNSSLGVVILLIKSPEIGFAHSTRLKLGALDSIMPRCRIWRNQLN